MPPRVHLVRHAQGFHNLSVANHSIHDPLLTPAGIEQCKTLGRDFPYTTEIDLVVASPLKRTVYTALYSFAEPIEKKKLKVIALPELQETSDLPCDTGSNPEEVDREFNGRPVDTSILASRDGKLWNSKKGRWAPNADAIIARAADARRWLLARPEKEIVVVTHGGFLHYFTEDWTGADKFAGTGWANTEYRTYTFKSSTDPTLVETPESMERRRGKEKPLSKEEQKNLQRSTTKQWEQQGYQKAKEISAKV